VNTSDNFTNDVFRASPALRDPTLALRTHRACSSLKLATGNF